MNDWLKNYLDKDHIKTFIENDELQAVYDDLTGKNPQVYSSNAGNFSSFLLDELSMDISEVLSYLDTIYLGQFKGVTTLKYLPITSSIDRVWRYALIDSSIQSIQVESSRTVLEHGAFAKAPNLRKAIICNSTTALPLALFNGSGIEEFDMPSRCIVVPRYMFYDCTNLKRVTLNEGIQSIKYAAFGNCTSLSSITIPASVEYITPEAFDGCTALTDVIFNRGSNITLEEDSLPNNTNLVVTCNSQDTRLIKRLHELNFVVKEINS